MGKLRHSFSHFVELLKKIPPNFGRNWMSDAVDSAVGSALEGLHPQRMVQNALAHAKVLGRDLQ